MLPYTDANWKTFFELAGRQDLLEDPRYATLASRLANIEPLYEELGKIVATRTNAEWLEALEGANVPAMVVNTLETLLEDPQLEATGFWKIVEHPTEGTLRTTDIPTTYSETPGEIRRLPPRIRRAQRRGAPRGGLHPAGDRRHAGVGGHAQRVLTDRGHPAPDNASIP